MDLNGSQIERLTKALCIGHVSYDDLAGFTLGELNERLPNIAANGPLPDVARKVIEWANSRGMADELVSAIARRRPHHERIQELIVGLVVESLQPQIGEARVSELVAAGLQRTVSPEFPFQNFRSWNSKLTAASGAVCRLVSASQAAIGSGFLVAPNYLLTAWHVVKDLDRRVKPAAIAQFDGPARSPDSGVRVFANDWLVEHSEVSILDYALVRIGGGAGRPLLQPGIQNPRLHQAVIVLQHPRVPDLMIALGSITAIDNSLSRVAYNANTDHGSSGSPCLDPELGLIALHHRGDADANTGVAMAAIRQDLIQKGHAALLAWTT